MSENPFNTDTMGGTSGGWGYPAVVSGSKLGVHSLNANAVEAFARNLVAGGARFPVVKTVDNLGWLANVKAVSPRSITMARFTSPLEGCQGVQDPGSDLDRMADELWAVIGDRLADNPQWRDSVDYWEVCNEPLGGGIPPEGYARLALLMIKCMERAEGQGVKLALFSFNAGTPEWRDMQAIVETGVFARAIEGGHILALHEGVFDNDAVEKWWNVHFVDGDGNPTTQNTGVTRPGGWIPDAPVLEGAGALCFRYRLLYEGFLKPRNEVVPLVVSEVRVNGATFPIDEEETVRRMTWYDELARQDYYVWAHCPFTLGPTSGWLDHDYEYAYSAMVSRALEIKDEPNGKPAGAPVVIDEEKPVWVIEPVGVKFRREPNVDADTWIDNIVFGSGTRLVAIGETLPDAGGMIRWQKIRTPEGREGYVAFSQGGEVYLSDQQPVGPGDTDTGPSTTTNDTDMDIATATTPVVIGLHDEAGGQFLRDNGAPKFCALVAVTLERDPIDLNFSHLGPNAIVVVRLNWSWARPSGSGTMPDPRDAAAQTAHVGALAETIRRNATDKNIWGWQLWNEVNNRSEWPAEDVPLTANYVIDMFNRVHEGVGGVARLAPPAIDPYFGPGSNPRAEWSRPILNGVRDLDFMVWHVKSQTNNPREATWDDAVSHMMFTDPPLAGWQFLHIRTMVTEAENVPARFHNRPVVVGEINPQFRERMGDPNDLGWVGGNAQWVHAAVDFVRRYNQLHLPKIQYMMFYRWEADDWAVMNDDAIKSAILAEARQT